MLHHNIDPTLFFHAEAMINPQLMTLGLSNGAAVALEPKGTAGAPARSAVLFAGVGVLKRFLPPLVPVAAGVYNGFPNIILLYVFDDLVTNYSLNDISSV